MGFLALIAALAAALSSNTQTARWFPAARLPRRA
jgi:hypothetical protein